MEAYITKSNSERILQQIDLKEVDIDSISREMQFKWFNKLELRKLKAIELLYSNPDLFLAKYVKLKPRESQKDLVFTSKNGPAYHTNETCEKMLSDYENIRIPERIMHSGKKQEFIEFCNQNATLLEKYPDQFYKRLKWSFGISESIEVRFMNSGAELFENMTLEELEEALENKIESINNWLQESKESHEIIEVFGVQSFNYDKPECINISRLKSDLSIEQVCETLKMFEMDIKKPLIELFKHYYRMKNNKTLSFNTDILSTLGFHRCGKCQQIRHSISFLELLNAPSKTNV